MAITKPCSYSAPSLPSPGLPRRAEAGSDLWRGSCSTVCSPRPDLALSPLLDHWCPPGAGGAGWSPACTPRAGWCWRSSSAESRRECLARGRLFCHAHTNLTAKEKLSIKTFSRLSQGSVCLMTTLFLPGLLSDYLCCETTGVEDKLQMSLPSNISVFLSSWKHEQDVKGF